MMNWPFELPPPNATARRALIDDECNHRGHEEVPAYTQEQVEACIAAALRWAAEEVRREVLIELHNRCIPASAAVADAVRRRVQSVLLRE